MFAHWPNQYSTYFELLQCIVKRTPALGRWETVDDFFEKTEQPYHQEHLPSRKFVIDWLSPDRVADASDLIAANVLYQKCSAKLRSAQNIANLCYQLENFRSRSTTSSEEECPAAKALPFETLDPALAKIADEVDTLFDSPLQASRLGASLTQALNQACHQLSVRFARACGHQPLSSWTPEAASASASNSVALKAPAHLLVNATSAPHRARVQTSSSLAAKNSGSWLYTQGSIGNNNGWLVDLPGYGVHRLDLQPGTVAVKRESPLAKPDGLLINDFLEAQIDPRSGALRSLHIPGKRGNRLSVQLARREKHGGANEYSQLAINSMQVVESTPLRGVIRVSGRMEFRGARSGEFEIDYELWRGSRILSMKIRLDVLEPIKGSTWQSAYVLRTAWPNESAVLTIRQCGSRLTCPSGKVLAPNLIDIDETDYHTYLLTGGLAFHQRIDQRFLETILTAAPARGGEFRFGIGVDLPSPVLAARSWMDPAWTIPLEASNSNNSAAPSWLMHIDAKHVAMDLTAPLIDDQDRCVGVRVHLTETKNASVTARIQTLREVREAHRVDYLGGRIAKLTVERDITTIAMRPNEMTFVDLYWKA